MAIKTPFLAGVFLLTLLGSLSALAQSPVYQVNTNDAVWTQIGTTGRFSVPSTSESFPDELWERPVEDQKWVDAGGTMMTTGTAKYYQYSDLVSGGWGWDSTYLYVKWVVAGNGIYTGGNSTPDPVGHNAHYYFYFKLDGIKGFAVEIPGGDAKDWDNTFAGGKIKIYEESAIGVAKNGADGAAGFINSVDVENAGRRSGNTVEVAVPWSSIAGYSAGNISIPDGAEEYAIIGAAVSNPSSVAELWANRDYPNTEPDGDGVQGQGVEYDTIRLANPPAPAATVVKTVTDVDGGGPSGQANEAGDVITYQIVVTNTGNVPITGGSLSDPLIAGNLTGPTESISNNGVLNVGETWTYGGTYVVTQADLDGAGNCVSGSIDNTATFSSTELNDIDDDATVTCAPNPAATILKTVTDVDGEGPSGQANEAGDVITYQIVVTNTGNVTINGGSLSDPLIAGNLTGPTESISTNGELNVGETWTYGGTYSVTEDDLIDEGNCVNGTIDNTATFSSTELSDIDDSASVPCSGRASATVVKTVTDVDGEGPSGQANEAGDVITYQIVVTNTGNVTINGGSLSDPLIAGNLTGPTESISTNGELNVGETWTYGGTYVVTQADLDGAGNCANGTIDNTATFSSTELDDIDDDASVTCAPNPAATILKTVTDVDGGGPSGQANEAGDVITYQIVVTNTGNVTINGGSLSDPLIAGNLTGPTESISTNGELNVGETWTYGGTYVVTQADLDGTGNCANGTIDNTGTFSSTELADIDDSVSVTCAPAPAATILKTVTDVDGEGPSGQANEAGDVITYQIVVTNTGNVTVTGGSLSDPLIAGNLTGPTESISSNSELNVGETWTYGGTYVVTEEDLEGEGNCVNGAIDNTATFSSTELNDIDDSATVICDPPSDEARALFRVEKLFMDGNDVTEVTFRIDCNTGLILDQEKTTHIIPGELGSPFSFEVEFVVTDFTQGVLNCTVSEVNPVGYSPSYDCDSNTLAVCDTGDPSELDDYFEGPCVYTGVDTSERFDEEESWQHLCVIRNYPNPVPVVINKLWQVEGSGGHYIEPYYKLKLTCDNEIITEGAYQHNNGTWSISFYNESGLADAQYTAWVIPDWDGGTSCSVYESEQDQAVEVDNGCESLLAELGEGDECTITNTVFFEGIPTLNQYGMAVLALLMLGMGLVGFRRFS